MSDTTGWKKTYQCGWEKAIGDHFFEVYIAGKGWSLIVGNTVLATRPTLHACQKLAHTTARLWAGETE